ncbi:hypothetical protein BGW80DRAFT_1467269 [Lactifluus volemus]|nr:hypothetical protein BGW80DRAFT_1467269 [Lactifluus volemus]
MPGSSLLSGLMPCTDGRRVMGTNKPKMMTFDAQIYTGLNEDGQPTCINAILNFFVPSDRADPSNYGVFFVMGKISLLDENTIVGENFDRQNYSLVIDASTFEEIAIDGLLPPIHPVIIVSGAAGKKLTDREFVLDIHQYTMGENRLVAHSCAFPDNSNRYKSKLPFPYPNTNASIVGYISGLFRRDIASSGVKRILVSINDIYFIASDSTSQPTPSTSPTKGSKTNYWSPSSNVAVGPSSPSKKRFRNENVSSSPPKVPRLSPVPDHKGKEKADPVEQDLDEPLTDIDEDVFAKEPSPSDKTRRRRTARKH